MRMRMMSKACFGLIGPRLETNIALRHRHDPWSLPYVTVQLVANSGGLPRLR